MEAFDREEKLRRSRTWLPTLVDSILVAQDQPLVEPHHRQEDGLWTLHTLEGLQAQLHVPSLGCTVALADVYDRLVFPTAEALKTCVVYRMQGRRAPCSALSSSAGRSTVLCAAAVMADLTASGPLLSWPVLITQSVHASGGICKGHNSHNSLPRSSGVGRPRSYPNTCRITGWTPCWRKRSCWRPRHGTLGRMSACRSAVRASWVPCSWS